MRVSHRLRSWWETSKRRKEKWLAKTMIRLAALPGKIQLSGKPPIRVLVDNSVLRHGISHTNEWISTGTKLWGEIPEDTGYLARVPVDYNEHNSGIYEIEVPYFAPLAHLASCGRMQMFTSVELQYERWRQRGYSPDLFGKNVWDDVDIERLPDLPRSRRNIFLTMAFNSKGGSSKESQIDHLLATADSEFLDISKKLPRKHILDFYHLWTAKYHFCDMFLTTDLSFRRVFENNISMNLRKNFEPVRIVRPSELASQLHLHRVPHHFTTPIDSDSFYKLRQPKIMRAHPHAG
ncbi:MAG: hypothetical protein M9939_21000 [Mesorhizobium sp.]|nr:hypothetical protein [Mesorhizobium sp.]MCO5163614.1 hypothetical protein [Mesorhizobium sp.]